MAVDLDIRSIESPVATEIYISAKPRSTRGREKQLTSSAADGRQLAGEIFTSIADILRQKDAYILREQIFVAGGILRIKKLAEHILQIRAQIYGKLDDGVAPSILVGKPESTGPITAVQVHAVCSNSRPEAIYLNGSPTGRILRLPGSPLGQSLRRNSSLRQGLTYLTLSSISAPQFDKATEQAQAMMEKSESVLKQAGSDFFSVARTWMWLGRILSWYGPFNRVRNRFFTERGLIGKAGRHSIPASTGIGLGLTDGSKCAMDLIAILQPRNSIQHLQSAGKQRCALEYGSAFSRACRAITPAGQTIFVSGTASIDASGTTTNIGDAAGQINTSIENVRAVLRDTQTTDEDVVQAVAYCKTTEVEKIFNDLASTLAWPCITVICDICRPELLFEIEATVLKKTTKALA